MINKHTEDNIQIIIGATGAFESVKVICFSHSKNTVNIKLDKEPHFVHFEGVCIDEKDAMRLRDFLNHFLDRNK